jgi:hypothetical protein
MAYSGYTIGSNETNQAPPPPKPGSANPSQGQGTQTQGTGLASGLSGVTPQIENQAQDLASRFGLDYSQILPALVSSQNQGQSITDQLNNLWAGNNYQGQLLQQQNQFSLQNLGLDTQSLGIQQGALGRQQALLPQQYALQTQGFDLSQQGIQNSAAQQTRGLNSSQTARGAYTSIGANQGRQDIQTQLQQNLANLGLQRQGAALNFQEQQAQNADSEKQLDIQSKRLGISKDELSARLNNALAQLGISGQVSANQLLQGFSQAASGEFTPLNNILPDVANQLQMPLLSGGS